MGMPVCLPQRRTRRSWSTLVRGVDGFAAAGGGLGRGDGRGGFAAKRAVDGEVAGAELFYGADERDDVAVLGAEGGAFAVDGLGTGDDELADGELVVADDFEHLAPCRSY